MGDGVIEFFQRSMNEPKLFLQEMSEECEPKLLLTFALYEVEMFCSEAYDDVLLNEVTVILCDWTLAEIVATLGE